MDDGENKKTLNILPMVGLVAVLIILIVLIFLIKGCTNNKKKANQQSEPSCILVYSRDTDKGNVYTSPVEVSIEATASGNGTIVEKNVGLEENGRRNRETYTVSSSGDITLYGYVEDSNGKTATCTDTIEVQIPVPTCELEVTEGDEGNDDWYVSTVKVEFKDVNVDGDAEIDTKRFDAVKKSGGGTVKSTSDSLTIDKDGKYEVTGTVMDTNGNEGTCTLEVNIDTTAPTCTLKKTKEDVSSSSSIDVEVAFDKAEDEVGKVEKGIGLEENYDTDTFKITKRGIFNVTGYVKDEAGNKGTCTIKVDTKTNTKPLSTPSCSFTVQGEKYTDNKNYCGEVTLVLDKMESTNGATITSYGIGTKEDYEKYKKDAVSFLNKSDRIKLDPVTKETSIEYYGIVEDSNGEIETCSFTTKLYPECAKKPKCELYQKSSQSTGNDVYQVVVAFKESGTYAPDGATITSYGLSLSDNGEFNNKQEITVNKSGKNQVYGYVKDSKGNVGSCGPLEVEISGSNANYSLLSSEVKVGDSVNYDAGKWESSSPIPTSQGTFGGYAAGTSKSKGVLCFDMRHEPKDGWVVISNANGIVKITTRGIPECYYHGVGVDGNISVSLINNEANKFLNNKYASAASIMNYDEATAIYNNYETSTGYTKEMYEKMLFAGDYYYLSTKGTNNGKKLKSVRYDFASAYVINERSGYSQGIRPVITLKENVYTSGKVNGAYELVENGSKSRSMMTNYYSLKDRMVGLINSIEG